MWNANTLHQILSRCKLESTSSSSSLLAESLSRKTRPPVLLQDFSEKSKTHHRGDITLPNFCGRETERWSSREGISRDHKAKSKVDSAGRQYQSWPWCQQPVNSVSHRLNKYLRFIRETFEIHWDTLFTEQAQMFFNLDKDFICLFGYRFISLCSIRQNLEPLSVSTVNDQKC